MTYLQVLGGIAAVLIVCAAIRRVAAQTGSKSTAVIVVLGIVCLAGGIGGYRVLSWLTTKPVLLRSPTITACRDLATNPSCTKVLFIGNSYTYVNDLPTTFATLARAGGYGVATGVLATGGATLEDHVASPETLSTIQAQKWTIVVLQDQSQNPSIDYYRENEMYPAAEHLALLAHADGAKTMFFLTPARENGWPAANLPSYAAMQSAVDTGYLTIAQKLDAEIAPVGDAWARIVRDRTNIMLWQSDGSHPTVAGTYLDACVFYASVFLKSPVGLSYTDGLSSRTAIILQSAAWTVVDDDPTEWGLARAG